MRHQFDIVAAWSVDRLGCSLQDLVAFLDELHGAGVDLYPDRQGVDTSTPAGKASFQMQGVSAEFERSIIQERIAAGIARARAIAPEAEGRSADRNVIGGTGGCHTGLPGGRDGIRKTARLVETGNATVARIAAEMQAGLGVDKGSS